MSAIRATRPKDVPLEDIRQSDDDLVIANYLTDESSMPGGSAEQVYFPANEAELSAVLRHAAETGTPVTVSGGGTGLTGSRMPLGGIVVSTEDLRAVSEELCDAGSEYVERGRYAFCLNSEEQYAVAPAGILVQDFQNILDGFRLLYPPTPTEMTCMLGGTVAMNASGGRTFHYGATRDWVRRVRVVLPDGDILDVRRGEAYSDNASTFHITKSDGTTVAVPLPDYTAPAVKNAAGYYVAEDKTDLVDLFVGAEGTLGAFSAIEVSLTDLPEEIFGCIGFFESSNAAVEFVKEARRRSRSADDLIEALLLDYMDGTSLDLIRDDYPNVPPNAGGSVYFEQVLDENDEERILQWAELLEEYGCMEDWSGFDAREQQQMKDMRHDIPETIHEIVRQRGLSKVATDLAVPEQHLGEMMAAYRRIGEESGLHYCFFGHIGDNHLHFNLLPASEAEMVKAKEAALELSRLAVEFGGTISAEHGCGKKAYTYQGREIPLLELMYGEEGLQSCARTKRALDPDGLLNRGNIVPVDFLK